MAQIAVDATQLEDLCGLVDDVLGHATEDRALEVAVIRVPLATLDALRGANAEVRVHATVAA